MEELKITEVKTPRQIKQFIELPLRMYRDCPCFVPALYGDEKTVFTDKNAYSDTCDSVFFLAMRGKKPVGRIQGIVQKKANELNSESRIRFTRFDCENNKETAKALFNALEEYALKRGLDTVSGPLGYSDLEREGLLIEGFEYLSTFEEQYNYEYYKELIEAAGYEKEIDWLEFRLKAPKAKNEMLKRVAERSLELNGLHIVDPSKMSKKEYVNKYKDGFFECLDICYKDLFGAVPFTDAMKKQLVDQFMLIINKEYLIIICDKNERVVSFALCIPGIGKALQKSGGRLTPAALIRLVRAAKKPKSVDLALIAILPEYRASGVNAVMLRKMTEYLESGKIEYFETNLNLESNTAVISQWKYFDCEQHKRRRAYVKTLKTAEEEK